ncbi:MAG: hypothetical protein ACK550_08885 [Synechococcaceae cyanobacterium]
MSRERRHSHLTLRLHLIKQKNETASGILVKHQTIAKTGSLMPHLSNRRPPKMGFKIKLIVTRFRSKAIASHAIATRPDEHDGDSTTRPVRHIERQRPQHPLLSREKLLHHERPGHHVAQPGVVFVGRVVHQQQRGDEVPGESGAISCERSIDPPAQQQAEQNRRKTGRDLAPEPALPESERAAPLFAGCSSRQRGGPIDGEA